MIAQNKKSKDSVLQEWLFAGPIGFIVSGMNTQESIK